MEYRIEKDTMGEVHVPADAYWGAQTQRSIDNFKIAQDINKMPKEIIKAFAYLKKAAALTNRDAGVLPGREIRSDWYRYVMRYWKENWMIFFPLVVWQTGSGTQSNMNVNEVVAYRACDQMVVNYDKEKFLHPNDDVNKSQSVK
jgi:fumarate hydratase class II